MKTIVPPINVNDVKIIDAVFLFNIEKLNIFVKELILNILGAYGINALFLTYKKIVPMNRNSIDRREIRKFEYTFFIFLGSINKATKRTISIGVTYKAL